MDRIINVKVGGNHLSKDNKNAGVKGEGNVTRLRITFDEGWDGYAKTVTFFDAHGNNPVKRIQGVDLIEDIVNDTRTYITPIPKAPLAIAGELTFVIDGYHDGKRQRSLSDKLVVKDAPDTDNAGEPVDPTPTQAEQLQSQIDKVLGDIAKAEVSADYAEEYAKNALKYQNNAFTAKESAETAADKANNAKSDAQEYAETATLAAEKAEDAILHSPIIVDGYWHIWHVPEEKYIDTGIKAQAGSTVYVGENPPDDADVWVYPDGEYSDPTTKLKQLYYYGDMNIVPSPEEIFTFELFQDEDGNFEDYYYKVSANPDAALTGDIVIPYEHNGLPVGGIDTFTGTKIQKVVLPKTIIDIYGPAFSGCTELTEITMNSFIYMPDETFRDCTSLKSITIPEGTAAMYGMLQGCTSLESITIPNSLISIRKNTFSGCTSLTDVYYEGSKAEWDKIEISEGNECLLNATIHYGYSDRTEGGIEWEIDNEISATSENAVQNKVVKAYVDTAIKTAIGDIDKALENIIDKYGLEGVE